MIKKALLLFIIGSTLSFPSYKKLSEIKSIYSIVDEVVYLNNEKKNKTYSIEYLSPDYLRKEIMFPNVNKGEIFQYEAGKVLIYIPLFEEVSDGEDENIGDFLSILNNLKSLEKNDAEFSKNYYSKKEIEIKYKNNYSIKIKNYQKIDEYLIPINLEIRDNDVKVAEIELKNTKINSTLKRKVLK